MNETLRRTKYSIRERSPGRIGLAGIPMGEGELESNRHIEATMSDDLSMEEYQRLAGETAVYPGRDEDGVSSYPALGLAGEAGEVCEHVKKVIRDDGGELTDERRRALEKELGDVLWYVAELATQLDLDLGEVARNNVEKLADREARDVIRGNGDDR